MHINARTTKRPHDPPVDWSKILALSIAIDGPRFGRQSHDASGDCYGCQSCGRKSCDGICKPHTEPPLTGTYLIWGGQQ